MNKEFLPVILGADINAYSMARLFHMEYNIKSLVVTTSSMSATDNTKILDRMIVKDLHNPDVFIETLIDIGKKYKKLKIKLILISCAEAYSNLMVDFKDELYKYYIIPYFTDRKMMDKLFNKDSFYELCEKHGLDYPKTFIYTYKGKEKLNLPFKFPVIAKPSNTITFTEMNFVGKKKAYKLDSKEELELALKQIYDAGYTGEFLIQDYIPGDDTAMFVLNCYSDKNGKVKMMSLGRVLLEEKSPGYIGNYAAIINEENKELMDKVKKFLENIHYVGISNFDIKYDYRDKTYKFFEINLRQGRSSFYVLGSGINLAKLIVDDYINNKELKFTIAKEPFLFLIVPKMLLFKYVNKDYKDRIKKLIKEKRIVNPFTYNKDFNLKRYLDYSKRKINQFRLFKIYY
jgi:D-aspartate ligase